MNNFRTIPKTNKSRFYFQVVILVGLAAIIDSCVPAGTATSSSTKSSYYEKQLRMDDLIYEDNIKSVMLYPVSGQNTDAFQPPIVSLYQYLPLTLEFEELGTTYTNYYAKIVNCTADWTPSQVPDMQILSEYNEYTINQYNMSSSTYTPFVHYKFNLPKVKQSGNYILMVYRDGNQSDFVLTRRFIVYENLINISPRLTMAVNPDVRETHQQLDFVINYPTFNIQNVNDLKVVVRQNYRWDNAIIDMKPLYIRENEKTLDFQFFNNENCFKGYNEFRVFDIRNVRYAALNVEALQHTNNKLELKLMEDKSKMGRAYELTPDINGRFLLGRAETNNDPLQADYVKVNFTLKSEKTAGSVYIIGGLTDWKINKNFLMVYDEASKTYKGQALLKQGYYNYMYALKQDNSNNYDLSFFENSYSVTENVYDILVYFRPFGGLTDKVIGYKTANLSGR